VSWSRAPQGGNQKKPCVCLLATARLPSSRWMTVTSHRSPLSGPPVSRTGNRSTEWDSVETADELVMVGVYTPRCHSVASYSRRDRLRHNHPVDADDVAAWVSAGGALVGAVAAIAAWRAADASARVSQELTAIEAARRHQELTPVIRWRIDPLGPGSSLCHLTLELEGPLPLQELNRLIVRIRDDRPGRDQVPLSFNGNALTVEQIRRQVWGPVRFTPGVGPGSNRSDQDGRTVDVTDSLAVGEGLRFQLEPTRYPWHSRTDAAVADSEWAMMVGGRLRLTVTAFADGKASEPWTLPYEVDLPSQTSADPG